MTKRTYGEGGIDQRGDRVFRLRYRVDGKRFVVTFRGSKDGARKELRRLLKSADDGEHVEPEKLTLSVWIDQWLKLLKRQPNGDDADERRKHKREAKRERKRGLVNPRTLERYQQLLDLHVKPALGAVALQKLNGDMIDNLYIELEQKLAVRTVLHIHNILRPCLAKAVRKRKINRNPADDADAPNPGDTNIATVLDEQQLQQLVRGFRGHPLEWIVDVAANTGARRNEIIALRWSDIDLDAKTMTISRSVEETKEHGRHVKEPKTERGNRTISLDAPLVERLRGYRDQYKRLLAGVPDGAGVNLGLVKLPEDALLFPGGDLADLTTLRDGHAVTRTFKRHAKRLGFNMRFHDIRASHLTILLDRGEPVHVVAARAGHDPVTLMQSYARRTKKADAKVAETNADISKGMV
jgi:integrase